jgi:hypothetical protein
MVKLGLYQHYKGGYYELLFIALKESDKSEQAVYRAEDEGAIIWIRPLEEFKERFILVAESQKSI